MSTFVDFDNPQKDKPHSFTVTVTGCKNCSFADSENRLCNGSQKTTWNQGRAIFLENEHALTNSCPMVAKEGEKK